MKDKDFCNRLIYLRKCKGMTQSDLEKQSGLSKTLISKYEKGTRAPGLANIKAIIRGLKCSADDLLR